MDKTQSELFNEELQALLNKYPTVRLTVAHQIQVEELKPAVEQVKEAEESPKAE